MWSQDYAYVLHGKIDRKIWEDACASDQGCLIFEDGRNHRGTDSCNSLFRFEIQMHDKKKSTECTLKHRITTHQHKNDYKYRAAGWEGGNPR